MRRPSSRWSSGHLPRRRGELGRAVHTARATLVEPRETMPQAKRPGWWRHGMSLFGGRSAPTDGGEAVAAVEPAKSKRGIPPAITRYAALGGGLRTAAPLAGMGQQDDRGPPGGMAAGCLRTLALDADTATMAGREQEGRPRTARRCRCDHSHSAREVRPCWRGRRPGLRVCDAAHLQQSGRAAWHDTQIRHTLDPPLPPLRRLQVSRRVRRDQEDDGPPSCRTRTWTSSDCA